MSTDASLAIGRALVTLAKDAQRVEADADPRSRQLAHDMRERLRALPAYYIALPPRRAYERLRIVTNKRSRTAAAAAAAAAAGQVGRYECTTFEGAEVLFPRVYGTAAKAPYVFAEPDDFAVAMELYWLFRATRAEAERDAAAYRVTVPKGDCDCPADVLCLPYDAVVDVFANDTCDFPPRDAEPAADDEQRYLMAAGGYDVDSSAEEQLERAYAWAKRFAEVVHECQHAHCPNE